MWRELPGRKVTVENNYFKTRGLFYSYMGGIQASYTNNYAPAFWERNCLYNYFFQNLEYLICGGKYFFNNVVCELSHILPPVSVSRLRSWVRIPSGPPNLENLMKYHQVFFFTFSINGHGKLDLFPQNMKPAM